MSRKPDQPPEPVTPRLETERLILRPPTPADATDVFAVHRHKSVADGVISIPHPCPEDHGETWIRWVLDDAPASSLCIWVIEERASGRVIGDCGEQFSERHRVSGIGYLLHPEWQGRRLMTEALRAVLGWLFIEHEPPAERVYADVFPENAPSLRVCERLGMTREGVLRGSIRKDEVQRDAVRLAVLRGEFLGA
ncbi:MAG: GNAT family N-acetyltransferase [Phycisphaeraceae bacterium]|nr:MAG: GNAT family N-acetyltransferase [Phycisphaeraceae bacterium]